MGIKYKDLAKTRTRSRGNTLFHVVFHKFLLGYKQVLLWILTQQKNTLYLNLDHCKKKAQID